MTIKLKLSTGKEIELTQEEYDELVKEKEYVHVPYQGTCPAPWWNPGPYTYPIVNYEDRTTASDCIGDKHI